MKTTGWLAMVELAGMIACAAQPSPLPERKVTVCMQSGDNVEVANRARARASKMFMPIGVRLEWRSDLRFCRQAQEAGSAAEASPAITIQVSNQAGVDLVTLVQAEKTATGIFKKTGVESRWIEPAAGGSFPLSHIQLKILPSLMSIRSGLPDNFPNNAVGLAPGSGPDRQSVYVFYDSVEAVATKHIADTHANTAQILGHAIAHEIGHLLLNVQTHSAAGIMRGDWNLWDLRNASYGYLLFTPRQAKAIREEAGRRVRQSQERRGSLTKLREEVL